MFDDFETTTLETAGGAIHARVGGDGPPLLLLHGYPQSHMMWHAAARELAQCFTVVASDLTGYGSSAKPPSTEDHAPYSKRAMARNQVEAMGRLGFDAFFVAGHDRGGRCAYRMALDHPERVRRLAVLDVVPTGEALARVDLAFGLGYWHWFFLAQPAPLPEKLIAGDPDAFFSFGGALGLGRGALPARGDGRVSARPARSGDRPRHVRGLPGRREHRPQARRGRPRAASDRLPAPRAVGSARQARRVV